MKYKNMDMDFKKGAQNLRHVYGEKLTDKIVLYTVNESVAKSNLSAVILVYTIINNRPILIAYGRVSGCGLDRGYEACYWIFRYAYPELKYQDYLEHRWL